MSLKCSGCVCCSRRGCSFQKSKFFKSGFISTSKIKWNKSIFLHVSCEIKLSNEAGHKDKSALAHFVLKKQTFLEGTACVTLQKQSKEKPETVMCMQQQMYSMGGNAQCLGCR